VTAKKPTRARQLGVTDEEYARLLAAQGGHCVLCPNTPKTRRLHVDHDHATGKVRGLLCYVCNRSLPASRDAYWHEDAARYLRNGYRLSSEPSCRGCQDSRLLHTCGAWNDRDTV
jgi:hypothetical protein